jgi:S-adenosyl-L-methionine hydrolase (adenosine-forming)
MTNGCADVVLTPSGPFVSVECTQRGSPQGECDAATPSGENLARPIITLTTDYGTGDHLVGVMKGVILSINPEVNVVDITHHVLAHDILDGAVTIAQAYSYFPPKTIHLVVVDPGVGTPRRPILVAGDQHYFVAPDNGVLSGVYDQTEALYVWNITSEHYFRNPVSSTFHGRDIFAPVAAWLSKSWQTAAFGDAIEDFVRFAIPKPKVDGTAFKCIVLKVDAFGNLMTNLKIADFPALVVPDAKFTIRAGKAEIKKILPTFASGAAGEAFAIVGSSGYLELCVNKGNASRVLGIGRGAEVTVQVE